MTAKKTWAARSAIALSLGMALTGCIGGAPTNRMLESVHQPVVERQNYTLDVTTGPGGMSLPEQRRLAGWFEAMDLRYGDRVTIDDPLKSGATRAAVEAVVARYGLLVGNEAPATAGYVNAGSVRIVLTRSTARVPGCPDWSAKSDTNLNNASSSNYGCASNANLAAMVADPEHLLKGEKGTGETSIMGSVKAIESYRSKPPSGEAGLKTNSTSGK